MRYVVAVLLLGTVLTIAPHVPLQAGPPKPQGAGGQGQKQIPPGSWLLYDSYDPKVPAFGPFRGELGCLRLAQTLNQYAMDDADDPYVCRPQGSEPEAKAASGGWIVWGSYGGQNVATFGPFATQERCNQLAETLNNRGLDEADDHYECRAK